jgi:hypothetical protein
VRGAGIDGKVLQLALLPRLRSIVRRAPPPHFSWCMKVHVFQANAPSPCNSTPHQSLLFFKRKVS